MPEICRPCANRKVKLCMYADDEDPPHFHIRSPDFSGSVDLATLVVTEGWIPRKELLKIRAYATADRVFLYRKWSELNDRD